MLQYTILTPVEVPVRMLRQAYHRVHFGSCRIVYPPRRVIERVRHFNVHHARKTLITIGALQAQLRRMSRSFLYGPYTSIKTDSPPVQSVISSGGRWFVDRCVICGVAQDKCPIGYAVRDTANECAEIRMKGIFAILCRIIKAQNNVYRRSIKTLESEVSEDTVEKQNIGHTQILHLD